MSASPGPGTRLPRGARRHLQRLAAPGAVLGVPADGPARILAEGAAPAGAAIDPGLVRALLSAGLLDRVPGPVPGARYALSDAAHAFLRRAAAPDAPFARQHQRSGTRLIEGEAGLALHAVNAAESPLGWLASRRGADGRALIEPVHVEAGERLREDYTRAQLMPTLTIDLSRPLSRGARGGSQASDAGAHALDARRRVAAALDAVGPGLADILIAVCCHLQGLESAERDLGWPARAGKIVLRIALERLAAHYGLARPARRQAGLRTWVAETEAAGKDGARAGGLSR